MRNVYRNFDGKYEEKKRLERPTLENNIKADLADIPVWVNVWTAFSWFREGSSCTQ
jgi:hypothetical protein